MKPYSYTSTSATSTFALTEWVYKSHLNCKTYVLPDGCRDIIVKQNVSQPETWFLSDLDDASYSVETEANSKLAGIRLCPGVDIDLVQLSSWLKNRSPTMLFGTDQLDEFCLETANLTEALDCLGTAVSAGASTAVTAGASTAASTGVTASASTAVVFDKPSILHVAKELGVSVRTLQRLVKSGTGKPPSFWFSLARVRKAGKALNKSNNISEVAYDNGYADQAHMTREMRKWFGKTPNQIINDPEYLDVLSEPGY